MNQYIQGRFYFLFLSIVSGLINLISQGESDSQAEAIKMGEISVSANRIAKETFRTPNSISVIEKSQMERITATITPQILAETVGILAQQTTVGQGSPILRGLTGYQTLLQIDNVRLNNSTFRSGPNQYLSTIAPHGLDRIEVLRGPNSMLYGSGAIGGVISVYSHRLNYRNDKKFSLVPLANLRFTSAQSGRVGMLGLHGGTNDLAFFVTSSVRRFGNQKLGSGYNLHYNNRKFEIVGDKPDPLPKNSWIKKDEEPLGWSGIDATAKLGYKINKDQQISFCYQTWRQPELNRYDKISTKEYELYQFSPQNRNLLYTTYESKKPIKFIDEATVTLSYQQQLEGRKQIKATNLNEQKEQFDEVGTFGLSGQAVSTSLPQQRIIFGGDFYLDRLSSRTVKTNLATRIEQVDSDWGRFPNNSSASDLNLFAQSEVEVWSDLQLVLGGRLTHYDLQADLSSRDTSFGLYQKSGQALTGNTGVVFSITENLNWVANFGTAFRSPNLNDTTVVEVTNEGIDAPSLDIDPESSWTLETGLKANFSRFIGAATLYHSEIRDLISRVPVKEAYDGKDLPKLYKDIQLENPDTEIFIQDNIDQTQIRGIELSGTVVLNSRLTMYGHGTITRGRILKNNGEPPNPEEFWAARIRREAPPMGMIALQWKAPKKPYWCEFYVRGAMEQRRLSRGDIRDPRIQGKTRDPKLVEFDENGLALDAGTPGWYTLNLRGGVKLGQLVRLNMNIENLLNRRYRQHGSGISSPGFNLTTSLSTSF